MADLASAIKTTSSNLAELTENWDKLNSVNQTLDGLVEGSK